MGLIEAALLGLIQGLTEFLPISSTAHIRIVPALLGWDDPGAPFTAAIQIGTLLAVLIYFRKELAQALLGFLSSLTGKGFGGRGSVPAADSVAESARMGWAIAIGTVPIVVLGLLFKDQIEGELRSLQVIAWSLIGLGVVLFGAERYGKRARDEKDVRPWDGLWVGLWQSLALVPGMSRSGSSIAGALLAGFDRAAAARFSFLLSVPSVFAAGVYSLYHHRASLVEGEMFAPMLVANVVSFFSGLAAIAFLLYVLRRFGTLAFVLYRIALGCLILWLLGNGTLTPLQGMPNDNTRSTQSSR